MNTGVEFWAVLAGGLLLGVPIGMRVRLHATRHWHTAYRHALVQLDDATEDCRNLAAERDHWQALAVDLWKGHDLHAAWHFIDSIETREKAE